MTKNGFTDRSYSFDAELIKRLDLYVLRFNLRMTEQGTPEQKIDKGQIVNQALEHFLSGVDA